MAQHGGYLRRGTLVIHANDLRSELGRTGLAISGTKDILAKRLYKHMMGMESDPESVDSLCRRSNPFCQNNFC